MAPSDVHEVEHRASVLAPAEAIFRLVRDVTNWPRVFPPTVHVERLEGDGRQERIHIWATANGEVKHWISRRHLYPDDLRIDYRQEVSQHPVAAMGGSWIIEPRSERECLVRLLHDYRAVDDDPDTLAWIDKALDQNSTAELAALKATAEQDATHAELSMSFQDSVEIAGSAADAYRFLYRAQDWERLLPHVAWVSCAEENPNIQILEMQTRTREGTLHRTRSVRVCFPETRIVYKQLLVPALATVHNGYWEIRPTAGGVTATSHHTVVLKEAGIAQVLGEGANVQDARRFVREALGHNSLTTLNHAKAYAEQRR